MLQNIEILKGVEIVDLGLYFTDTQVLVISDLHIGYEQALVKQGVLIPKFHFKDLVDRLIGMFKILEKQKKEIKLIIINGDLKHEFGTISDEEWRNTLKVLDLFAKKCEKIVLIKGNHDKILEPIAKKKNVLLVDQFLDGEFMFIHGDKKVKIPEAIKTVVIGHEHPAIVLSDEVRREKYKCFLSGKTKIEGKKRNLIVVPSMNLLLEGTDVVSDKLLSPYLKLSNKEFLKFDVYVVGDNIYSFGKVKNIF